MPAIPKFVRKKWSLHPISEMAMEALNEGSVWRDRHPAYLEVKTHRDPSKNHYVHTSVLCPKCGFSAELAEFSYKWRGEFKSQFCLLIDEKASHPEFEGAGLAVLVGRDSGAILLAKADKNVRKGKCCKGDGDWYRWIFGLLDPEFGLSLN